MSYGVITPNLFSDLINNFVASFTSPTSPLRNRWVQTFVFCFLIIVVSVVYYYTSGEYKKKIPPPVDQTSLT